MLGDDWRWCPRCRGRARPRVAGGSAAPELSRPAGSRSSRAWAWAPRWPSATPPAGCCSCSAARVSSAPAAGASRAASSSGARTWRAAARREALEEAGVEVRLGEIVQVATNLHEPEPADDRHLVRRDAGRSGRRARGRRRRRRGGLDRSGRSAGAGLPDRPRAARPARSRPLSGRYVARQRQRRKEVARLERAAALCRRAPGRGSLRSPRPAPSSSARSPARGSRASRRLVVALDGAIERLPTPSKCSHHRGEPVVELAAEVADVAGVLGQPLLAPAVGDGARAARSAWSGWRG